jgi:hypothetical protein
MVFFFPFFAKKWILRKNINNMRKGKGKGKGKE